MDKIRIGQVGLGRLGRHYAENIHFHLRQAELVSICSLEALEIEHCRALLGDIPGFNNYDEMLNTMDLDAVVVVSSTNRHVEHIMKAVKAGCHVFCEKPLSVDIEECKRVEEFTRAYPDKKVMIGFNRRYDMSYRYAKEQIDAGLIGNPFFIRSQTVDIDTVAEFQLKFAQHSGGIFIDYNVHDIDLMRWFLQSEVERVWAQGGAYKFPEFAKYGDADYVMSSCQLKNGAMAVLCAGRMATHGHDTYTEITGTEGSLRIGRPAYKNLVEIYDKHGVRRESLPDFWERFKPAFLDMIEDFCHCVIHDFRPVLDIYNARKATEVALALSRSFKEGGIIDI